MELLVLPVSELHFFVHRCALPFILAYLYLKRDGIVRFKNTASKNQIPTINSYTMSTGNLNYCKARISDMGAFLEFEPSEASTPKVILVTLSGLP
jgi:hypothetical protein